MSLKSVLSTIGLVGLIVFDAILIAICGICHQWWWMNFFISITLLVLIFEGLSYLITGKTISQHWWAWSEKKPKQALWSLGALVSFLLAMNFLALHLAAPMLAKVFGG
jgi:hypothetical protein